MFLEVVRYFEGGEKKAAARLEALGYSCVCLLSIDHHDFRVPWPSKTHIFPNPIRCYLLWPKSHESSFPSIGTPDLLKTIGIDFIKRKISANAQPRSKDKKGKKQLTFKRTRLVVFLRSRETNAITHV